MIPTVALSGELDVYRAPWLRTTLETVCGPAVVDMRDVQYVDSSALTELVRVARRAGLREVTLVVGTQQVRRVFALVDFDKLFRIVDAADVSRLA